MPKYQGLVRKANNKLEKINPKQTDTNSKKLLCGVNEVYVKPITKENRTKISAFFIKFDLNLLSLQFLTNLVFYTNQQNISAVSV